MHSIHPFSNHFRGDNIPQFHISHFINEEHSNRHSRLPHIHEDFLELFYVYGGTGRYMVDGHSYDIQEGDIVICNAGVLHGENPSDPRQVRSYSVGISHVALLGLQDNTLCEADVCPVLSCGLLKQQVGELFRLIYLLSNDPKTLGETCTALSISLLLLTYELLQSRERNTVIRTRTSASATADRVRRYLDKHYREALTLEQISRDLHINAYYLSHTF